MARSPEPIIPAPSGKYTGMPDYIAHAMRVSGGTARSLGEKIGLSTGSRVSDWRQGYGVPGVLSCLRLAKVTGDDPADVLTMAGHKDVVDILEEVWARHPSMPEAAALASIEAQAKVAQAIRLLEMAKEAVTR